MFSVFWALNGKPTWGQIWTRGGTSGLNEHWLRKRGHFGWLPVNWVSGIYPVFRWGPNDQSQCGQTHAGLPWKPHLMTAFNSFKLRRNLQTTLKLRLYQLQFHLKRRLLQVCLLIEVTKAAKVTAHSYPQLSLVTTLHRFLSHVS